MKGEKGIEFGGAELTKRSGMEPIDDSRDSVEGVASGKHNS